MYYDAVMKVQPLMTALREAERSLRLAEGKGTHQDKEAEIMEAARQAMTKPPQEGMEAAKAAMTHSVNYLTKPVIQELKSLGKPPLECVEVCAAVAFLLKREKKKRDWKGCQKMMSNPGASMEELLVFDANGTPDDVLKRVQPMVAQSYFNFDTMRCKSSAAAILTNWVVSTVIYIQIYKGSKATPIDPETEVAKQAKVLAIFKSWDVNGDGTISHDELKAALLKIGMHEKQIHAAFEKADANKDGLVDYEEFIAWVYATPHEAVKGYIYE